MKAWLNTWRVWVLHWKSSNMSERNTCVLPRTWKRWKSYFRPTAPHVSGSGAIEGLDSALDPKWVLEEQWQIYRRKAHLKYSLVLSSSCRLPNKQVLRPAALIYILNSFPSIGQPSFQTQININPYIHYSIYIIYIYSPSVDLYRYGISHSLHKYARHLS